MKDEDWEKANKLQEVVEKKFNDYSLAMELKNNGNFLEAANLLELACKPASIYKGHYRELFKIYRIFNKADIENQKYQSAKKRILRMIKYDEQMIGKMLGYWSKVNKTKLPDNYFDKDRNVKISDVKALLKISKLLDDEKTMFIANELMSRFK